MSSVAIVYFSGYGHTAKQAEAVRDGAASVASAKVKSYRISETGDLPEGTFEEIGAVHAIIYGSPTYMGGPAWQFKKFADASSRPWLAQAWKNKLAAGFTNSASVNGDKFSTIEYFWTLSQQHGQIWIGTLTTTHRKGSESDGLISMCGRKAGTWRKLPAFAVMANSPRARRRTSGGMPNKTYAIVCCAP
jgi:NAD(P)H dehydrogenase (quinone)